VFTSGSTGTPKGVVIPHGGLFSMIEQQIDAFCISRASRVLQFASLSFDASVSEMFCALVAGATLVLIDSARDRQGTALLDLLDQARITVVTLPPSLLSALPPRELPALATLVSAGEACTPNIVERWSRPHRRLLNAYGPSEASVCATIKRIADRGDHVTIGRALHGTYPYVLDDQLEPVAVGGDGELFLGGIRLARGYIAQPGLTAERFVPDPFCDEPGARMYRTGDRVRLLAGGELDYIERVDRQLKLRGFRVEPAEVEQVLRRQPTVRDAVVGLRRRGSGDPVLVAWILGDPRAETAIRVHARRNLTGFMQPAEYVFLPSWPLTPAGKVDRNALPLATRAIAPPVAPPRTPSERLVVQLFEDMLELQAVSPDDSFFDLGGDSITASRMLLRLENKTGRRVGVGTLLERPTATALGQWLDRSAPRTSGPVVLRPGDAALPLWLIPPVHGNPLCYLELSRRASPGRPFHAARVPGLDDSREPLDDLVALARDMVDQIARTQPDGPYHLAGWSMGGMVAFEIALQLQAAGCQVGSLILLAATPPDPNLLAFSRRMQGDCPPGRMGYMYACQIAHSLGRRLDLRGDFDAFDGLPEDEACRLFASRLISLGVIAQGDTSELEIRRWLNVFRASLWAFLHYDPAGRYRGRTLEINPVRPNPLHFSPLIHEPVPAADWSAFLDHRDIRKVDGDPVSLLSHPWVDAVADAITSWIDEDARGRAAPPRPNTARIRP
jgi:thioesterase domain-containing protein